MTEEIRVRSFGELLDGGFRVLTARIGLFVALGAVVYVPAAAADLAILLLQLYGVRDASSLFGAWLLRMALPALVVAATFPLAAAALASAAADHCRGRHVAFGDCLRRAGRIYLPVAGTNLLAWTLILVGLVAVVPGVVLGAGLLVVGQVMVVEEVFGVQALRRSWHLMRGHLMRGLTLTSVMAVMVTVPPLVLQFLLATLPVVGYPVTTLAYSIGLAYSVVVTVLFYFDLRCRKEAFDLTQLAAAVEARAGQPS